MSFWQKLARYFESVLFPHHDDPSPEPTALVVVRSGDSLWKIAEELVGDGLRWQELAAVNADKNFDADYTIQPGEQLKVPCAWLDDMAEAAV